MTNDLRRVEIETALGIFTVIGSPSELIRILFPNEELSEYKSVRLLDRNEHYPVLSDAADTLNKYFRGEPVSWAGKSIPSGTSFRHKVWKITAEIPFGKTLSYGELAAEAGSPKAARAVGSAMAANPIPILVPCHRVVGSNGALCGFGGGLDVKRWLLKHEGVVSP